MASAGAEGAQTACETTLSTAGQAASACAVASTSTCTLVAHEPKKNGDLKGGPSDTCGLDEAEKSADEYHNATTLVRGEKVKRSTDVS